MLKNRINIHVPVQLFDTSKEEDMEDYAKLKTEEDLDVYSESRAMYGDPAYEPDEVAELRKELYRKNLELVTGNALKGKIIVAACDRPEGSLVVDASSVRDIEEGTFATDHGDPYIAMTCTLDGIGDKIDYLVYGHEGLRSDDVSQIFYDKHVMLDDEYGPGLIPGLDMARDIVEIGDVTLGHIAAVYDMGKAEDREKYARKQASFEAAYTEVVQNEYARYEDYVPVTEAEEKMLYDSHSAFAESEALEGKAVIMAADSAHDFFIGYAGRGTCIVADAGAVEISEGADGKTCRIKGVGAEISYIGDCETEVKACAPAALLYDEGFEAFRAEIEDAPKDLVAFSISGNGETLVGVLRPEFDERDLNAFIQSLPRKDYGGEYARLCFTGGIMRAELPGHIKGLKDAGMLRTVYTADLDNDEVSIMNVKTGRETSMRISDLGKAAEKGGKLFSGLSGIASEASGPSADRDAADD